MIFPQRPPRLGERFTPGTWEWRKDFIARVIVVILAQLKMARRVTIQAIYRGNLPVL
jgi:hypothetical protein